MIDGDRYQYGFSCTKERIVSEWLYVHPNISGRKRVFFERVFDDENNTTNIEPLSNSALPLKFF